jgi:riboflavin kinase/FMN adenylyltransferase
LVGTVVRGDQRGRSIGFPTANLEIADDLLIPGSGVFAVRAFIDGIDRKGVVNIGRRPTFGGTESVVEAHILDFSGDLYGQQISLDFIERLRSEQKFAGIEELVSAIRLDVAAARNLLEES